MPAPKVIIRGAVYDYAEKAPYVQSGASVQGGIEATEGLDRIKCHECGKFFKALGFHLTHVHKMNAREYRTRHGLRMRAGLCSPVLSKAKIASNKSRNSAFAPSNVLKKPHVEEKRLAAIRVAKNRQTLELRNEHKTCVEQLKQTIRNISKDLGRTPCTRDLVEKDFGNVSAALARLGCRSLDEMMALVGLEPTRNLGAAAKKYTQAVLVEALRDAKGRLGRIPKQSDCHAPLLPSYPTIVSYFGSWQAALDAAGFGLLSRRQVA